MEVVIAQIVSYSVTFISGFVVCVHFVDNIVRTYFVDIIFEIFLRLYIVMFGSFMCKIILHKCLLLDQLCVN